jgi:putative DNA primase/helicase
MTGNKPPRLAGAKTEAAVERLARSDRRLIANTEQWDTDPFLLATPNGIVDLTTGNIRRPMGFRPSISKGNVSATCNE